MWIVVGGLVVVVFGYVVSCDILVVLLLVFDLVVNFNLLIEIWCNINFVRGNWIVFFFIFGILWFWLYGVFFFV